MGVVVEVYKDENTFGKLKQIGLNLPYRNLKRIENGKEYNSVIILKNNEFINIDI